MSLDGRLGAPMQVKSFLRLGIGIAIAAFHIRGLLRGWIEWSAIAFSFMREVRLDAEKRVAGPWG